MPVKGERRRPIGGGLSLSTLEDALGSTGNILPHAGTVIQGTWSYSITVPNFMGGVWVNTSDTNGDKMRYYAALSNGTWYISILASTFNGGGIIQVDLDGITAIQYDLYSVVRAGNVILENSFEVISNQVYAIDVYVNGKNASSSGYEIQYSAISLYRIP